MKTLINLKHKYYDRHPHRRLMNGLGDWYIGYVEELRGVNIQEATLEESRESLLER